MFPKIVSMAVFAGFLLASAVPVHAAVDAEAARALAKKNDCFKCHAEEKTKKGPSYKKIAEKYRNDANWEKKLTEQLTKEPMVKLDDGTEERHRKPDLDAGEMKTLLEWIRTR